MCRVTSDHEQELLLILLITLLLLRHMRDELEASLQDDCRLQVDKSGIPFVGVVT